MKVFEEIGTSAQPLSTLLENVDLRGGHLYESEPDPRFAVGGEVYGVVPLEEERRLWVRTKSSSDSHELSGIVLFDRCTWRQEAYMQCDKGTFGCIIIDDPETDKQITIHGVRLHS